MRIAFVAVLICVASLAEARLPDLIPYRKGNRWGYCDSTKKIKIEPRFRKVSTFSESTALIYVGYWYGMIDSTGKVILRPFYSYIDDESVNNCRIVRPRQNGPCGIINAQGKTVVPFEYSWLGWAGPYIRAIRNNMYGVLDHQGNVVIPFIYEPSEEAPGAIGDSGLFIVKRIGAHRDSACGVIDITGRVVIPFQYDYVAINRVCGFHGFQKNEVDYYSVRGEYLGTKDPCKNHFWWPQPEQYWSTGGIRRMNWEDSTGAKLGPVDYLYTDDFSNGYARFRSHDSVYGYVNLKFDVVIQPAFSSAYDFSKDGLANVWMEVQPKVYKEGYIDIYGTRYWED